MADGAPSQGPGKDGEPGTLREEVELLRVLTDSADDLISLRDLAGRPIYTSPSITRLFGRPPSPMFEFAHPDDVARCEEWWTAMLGGATDLLRWRARDTTGHFHWLETSATRVQYRGAPHVVTVCRDTTDRVEAQAALAQSERLLRQVLDALPVGVVVTDISGNILFGNPASVRVWDGMLVEGAERYKRSKGWWHDSGKPIAPDEWASVGARLRGETSINELIDIETFTGGRKIMCNSAAPIRDATGTIIGAVIINEDVTTRHQTEDALHDEQRKLAQAQRIALLGYWEYDFVADRIAWSDEAAAIIGLPPHSTRTLKQFRELIHPDDRALQRAAMDRAIGADGAYDAEYRVIRPDGEVRFVHSVDEITRDASGRPLRAFGVWKDVTERVRAGEAALAAEQRLEHVVASSPAVLFTVGFEAGQFAGISWMSDNVVAMLGYQVDETLGADWWLNSIHPEDRDAVVNAFLAQISGGDFFTAEYRLLHKDGRYRWIRGESRLLRDAGGQPVEVVGSLTDITQRRRLEDQFRQAQKMEAIGELAAGVAHDFNNLLVIISGYSELLLPELLASDPRRLMVEEIRDAGKRATVLTRQLLAFSRKAVIEPIVLDLGDVVRENEKILARIIGEDVALTAVLAADSRPVKVDPGQIGQVLLNLAVNARDAMPSGGKLTIETAGVVVDEMSASMDPELRPGEYVMLAVTDTGTGMSADVRSHIFEPFFTTKGPGKGTGLGLATVYGIVKQSDGLISVYSQPGRGATFKLYFPVTAESVTTPDASPRTLPMARGSETILLVEDEDAVRAIVRVVLKQAGYTVLDASRGAAALEIAAAYPGSIDLMITDVVMPEMGGRELVERMTSVRPGLKLLYMSGYTDDAVVRHGVLKAEVAFVQKPFTMAGLALKVRQVLDAGSG